MCIVAAGLGVEHRPHAFVVERPPPLVDVAGFGELAADRPVAHALLVQPLDQVDDLGSLLGVRLAPLSWSNKKDARHVHRIPRRRPWRQRDLARSKGLI